MSATSPVRSVLPPDIKARKGSQPLVVLTAYTTPIARLVDAHCDIALVGDSVGMVLHGMPSTLGVTMEMMILHGRAVVRGSEKAMVVIDMPFGTYEEGPQQAFRNASRLMAETGAPAVKLEGGLHMAETIAFLTARGVPVMAHVGLTPQAINTLGGYKVVGRDDEAAKVMADARAVAEAGAFSVVLEKVPMGLAGEITRSISIPTIGIGAGVDCDGQVLVVDDMLGLFTAFRPKFVKRFGALAEAADAAIAEYAAEVRARTFPGVEHSFPDVLPSKGKA
jgi:3-methyl-2-oxobutanoate hydroxymethyltransferase